MATPFPWRFPYQRDAPRLREVLRPLVSVRLVGPDLSNAALALVDTGCDHILAAPWVVQDAGIDLRTMTHSIELGIGGHSVEARFVSAQMRLQHPDGDDDDYVEWDVEIGAVDSWHAPWPVLLGQNNFMSRFTVSMHRAAGVLVVEDWHAFDRRFGVDPRETDETPRRFDP